MEAMHDIGYIGDHDMGRSNLGGVVDDFGVLFNWCVQKPASRMARDSWAVASYAHPVAMNGFYFRTALGPP
eukprot:3706399-Rhodomonas_salina.3